MRIGEVEVDGGGGKAVMAENFLDGRERDSLLQRQGSEGMAQHMGGDVLGGIVNLVYILYITPVIFP